MTKKGGSYRPFFTRYRVQVLREKNPPEFALGVLLEAPVLVLNAHHVVIPDLVERRKKSKPANISIPVAHSSLLGVSSAWSFPSQLPQTHGVRLLSIPHETDLKTRYRKTPSENSITADLPIGGIREWQLPSQVLEILRPSGGPHS